MQEGKELLKRCIAIIQEEDAKLIETGDGFNLFEILMHGNEELLHSKMVASFLDPKGSHHQGYIFLNEFLKTVRIDDFDAKSASVICEKHIGFQDGDNPYGRIDIFIKDGSGHKIIIENKWDAGDQPMQLARYHEYAPDAKLLYLTRFGKEPSDYSKGPLKDSDFKCISYSSDIIEWLSACLSLCETKKAIAIAIESYIKLITKMNMLDENDTLLHEITKSGESVNAAFKIAEKLNKVKIKSQLFLWEQLYSRLQMGGLEPEYCTKINGREVSNDFSVMKKAVMKYTEGTKMTEGKYGYGIRIRLGQINGVPVFGAILLNWNIYFAFYTDDCRQNKDLSTHFSPNDNWRGLKGNYKNFAWKYPYSEQYNFVDFKKDEVRQLAANDTRLVDIIFDEFIIAKEEVKNTISI